MKVFASLQSVMFRFFPYCAPSQLMFMALVAETLLGGKDRNDEEVM